MNLGKLVDGVREYKDYLEKYWDEEHRKNISKQGYEEYIRELKKLGISQAIIERFVPYDIFEKNIWKKLNEDKYTEAVKKHPEINKEYVMAFVLAMTVETVRGLVQYVELCSNMAKKSGIILEL